MTDKFVQVWQHLNEGGSQRQNYPRWAWDKPSLAVVASDGSDGVVLWTAGPALRFEMEEGGLRFLSDLGLDDAPKGISVWEGRYFWRPGPSENPADGESEVVGTFREPTEAEWRLIREDCCPWNEDSWRTRITPMIYDEKPAKRGTRACEKCHGPGPVLWNDIGQRYCCKKCHDHPEDPFFVGVELSDG